MCGIAGILDFYGPSPERALLERMIRMVRHRGPDEEGVITSGPVGLAHARLSIIDLEMGQQPMANADGSVWLTYNGEVYNYVELREELERDGYRFRTRSDTEVILALYERDEERCVERLNGQWAFALWDGRRQQLFLSRDRLGVRPLHFTKTSSGFLFGSEVKSLFAHPDVPRRIDRRSLMDIFTFWGPRAPRTAFETVSELPPGSCMRVTRDGEESWRYWQPTYPTGPALSDVDERRWLEELKDTLAAATRLRLRSDVPVGAYLSGGLDSSLTAALMREATTGRMCTFSVSFEDPAFDESDYQREVARGLGTEHHVVRCSNEDIGAAFSNVIWHTERPILRTAPAPLFLLSRLVAETGIKVVLTGEGADEMLGGYDIFKEAAVRRFWARQPSSKSRPRLLERLYPYMSSLKAQSPEYLQAFFRVDPASTASPLFSHLPRWELTRQTHRFFSADTRGTLTNTDPYEDLLGDLPADYRHWAPLCQAQYLETTGLLSSYLLSSQGDRMATAHGIEARFPFLDPPLVELAARMPPRLKLKGLNEKYLLKRAAAGLVPESVTRRSKQPYRAPDAEAFFGANTHSDEVRALLSRERLARDGLFDPDRVERLVAKAARGRPMGVKDHMAFVGVLSTQMLADRFIHNFRYAATGRQP